MSQIFVRATGQDDNIGDVVLRREMFDAVRGAGRLHILLGDASQSFIDALNLDPNDVVIRSARDWKRGAWASLLSGKSTWLVDKPGEVQVSRSTVKAQAGLLPLVLAVRARGGKALRLGVGQRAAHTKYLNVLRLLWRASNVVAWRDTESHTTFGFGRVMPDWAFRGVPRDLEPSRSRDRLVLSYRGDRAMLADSTLDEVRQFAQRNSYRLTVVVQVARDADRSRTLAAALDAELIDWPSDRSHFAQEERLREVYQESRMVLSDRLHVLILAAIEGAVPANLVGEPDYKVARHFDAVGMRQLTMVASGRDGVRSFLDRNVERTEDVRQSTSKARRSIGQLMAAILAERQSPE